MLIPKSILFFHTFAPTTFDDSDFIIARLYSMICMSPWFAGIPYIYHFGAIMGLRISSDADFRSFPFTFERAKLLLALHGRSCPAR